VSLRVVVVVPAVVCLVALATSPAVAGVKATSGYTDNHDSRGTVTVANDEAAAQGAPTTSSGGQDQWVRNEICEGMSYGSAEILVQGIPDCSVTSPPITPPVTCADGQVPLPPWWVNPFVDGAYTYWQLASGYQCAGDILLAQVEAAWASMPIAPNTYGVQPATGYAIAELGVILAVDTAPRTIDVTLMGTPVTIRAVANQYTWTNTDGTTWTSTDPGKPLEDGGKPFTFPRVAEHRSTFTLTTTWRGEFTTNGGATWRDAPGTATTTSHSTTVHIYNPHTHLVDCDLNGNCVNGSQGGGNQKTILDPDGDGIDNYLIPDDKIDDYLATRDQDRTWTDIARKG